MGSTGTAAAMNTGNVAVSAGQAVDVTANERTAASRVDNVKLRTDTYNRNLLTSGTYADRLRRNGIVAIGSDYYAGTISDMIRVANEMGYEAVYDRGNDEVRIGRSR